MRGAGAQPRPGASGFPDMCVLPEEEGSAWVTGQQQG